MRIWGMVRTPLALLVTVQRLPGSMLPAESGRAPVLVGPIRWDGW